MIRSFTFCGRVAAALSVLWLCSAATADDAKPNFVLIIADDCTYTDLGCYGGQANTPHLDRLCEEGVRFNRCFQAAPMCSPTRHCLYTGLYPVRSGAYPNHTFVKRGTKSIGHYLKNTGYRVALSGKTHINPPASFPFEYSKDNDIQGTNPNFEVIEDLIKECKESGTPFCALLCSNEPHSPYTHGDPSAYDRASLTLPPHFVDTPETREAFQKYLAEITFFDSQVGQCLDLLDEYGLADNTLVLVLSEQGNSFPFAKWTCYDAGVQSGMIVRWPGHVKPGTQSDAIVEYVDVTPTFVDAAGAAASNEKIEGKTILEHLDGKSFLPVLEGESDEHKEYAFALQTTRGIINGSDYYGIRSVRSPRYRYIRNLSPEQEFKNAVYRTDWWQTWVEEAEQGNDHAQRVTRRYTVRPAEELYDCESDPWNLNNLADDPALADVKKELSAELDRWMESQGDQGHATEMRALQRLWRNRDQNDDRPGRAS